MYTKSAGGASERYDYCVTSHRYPGRLFLRRTLQQSLPQDPGGKIIENGEKTRAKSGGIGEASEYLFQALLTALERYNVELLFQRKR